VNLNWSSASGATSYSVKRSTTTGGPYSTIAATVTGVTYADTTVTNGTTYYYVVTAANGGGESTNSNESSATPTAPISVPAVPINITATAGDAQISLSWSAVATASGYKVKRSTTAGGPYTTVAENISGTPYIDTNVVNGTAYYYVVTAINTAGESGNSNEASATPTTPTNPNRAILTITFTSGLEKEYDLSMSAVDAFTAWYDAKAAGSGPTRYVLGNPLAHGPFSSRTTSVIFDKILTFDIDEYTPAN
jgi:fibronectin type 3 domain-containing protein